MSREAFVNGEYIEYINSKVHIEDRGYQFADGVYEVFAVLDSKIVDYEGHIKRLYRSLRELNISSPIQRKSYKFHINEIIKRNIIQDGLVYLEHHVQFRCAGPFLYSNWGLFWLEMLDRDDADNFMNQL